MSADGPNVFDLTTIAGHELVELGARVRRCRDDQEADFADIAQTIVDMLWASVVEKVPPMLALVRLYRVCAVRDLESRLRARAPDLDEGARVLVLAGTRGIEPAWNDVEQSKEHRVVGLDAPHAPMVAQLARDLRLHGHADGASPGHVFYVPDAVGSGVVPAQAEFVLRYGVRTVVGCGGPLAGESGFALVMFSRAHLSHAFANGFGSVGVNAGIALGRAKDLAADPLESVEGRARDLDNLLRLHEYLLLKRLVDVTRELDAFRERQEASERTVALEIEAGARRQERTQRAMLNVIEDLREARADLERRVEERTRELAHSNEELRSSNAELEQFAYVASHDLQEPLRTIAGYLQLLEERYGDRLDDAAREFIGFAVQGSHRMQELIEALLVYSRVARAPLAAGVVALDGALDDAMLALARAIEDSRASIERRPLPTVRGDPVLLRQLFQNLLSNAIKFAGTATPRIEIDSEQTSEAIEVRVRDHGVGFDPRYSEQIFKVFRRLQRKQPGTGIGLAICRKIVERHGGSIRATSAPGQGATFQVSLPRFQ